MASRILLILITILIAFSSLTPQAVPEAPAVNQQEPAQNLPEKEYALEDPFYSGERTDINFSDIKYERPDAELFFSEAARIKTLCEMPGSFDEISSVYEFLYSGLLEISTASTLSYLQYAKDAKNSRLSEEYEYASNLQIEAADAFDDAVIAALNSMYSDEFTALIGPAVAETYTDAEEPDAVLELKKRENELCAEYLMLSTKEYSIEYDGAVWTLDSLYADQSLSYEEYSKIGNLIYARKNEDAVELYIELTETRKQIAAAFGYDSYAEYCYKDVYGRSYTPEDAESFHMFVKRHTVPIYNGIYYRDFPDGFSYVPVKKQDIIPLLERYIPRISPDMEEALNTMVSREMYFWADDTENTVNEGFTTILEVYSQPYIYNSVYGYQWDIQSSVHEFGHYCNYFINEPKSLLFFSDDLDCAEVHSLGLEMVFYGFYDEIYQENSNEMKAELLTGALKTIVDGCMYDEAQQRVFEEDELTPESVNKIFADVAAEYHASQDFDSSLTWVDIQHTFTSPFYYISYAASQTAALELWLTGVQEGQDAAIDKYMEFCSYDSYEYGFLEVLDLCGMESFMSEDCVFNVSDAAACEVDALYEDYCEDGGELAA